MKAKKINGKLTLGKLTIASLSKKNMTTVKGGWDTENCQGVHTVECTIDYTGCQTCPQTLLGLTC